MFTKRNRMNKEGIIKLWNELLISETTSLSFKNMAYGRFDKVGDGWRTAFSRLDGKTTKIVLERNPVGYWIYIIGREPQGTENRFQLENNYESEEMCIQFDKLIKERP